MVTSSKILIFIHVNKLQIKWKITTNITQNKCNSRDQMSKTSTTTIRKLKIINMILGCLGLWISLFIRTQQPRHFLTINLIKIRCQSKILLILPFIPVLKALNISCKERWLFRRYILYTLIRKIILFCQMFSRITHHHHSDKNRFHLLIIISKISCLPKMISCILGNQIKKVSNFKMIRDRVKGKERKRKMKKKDFKN